MDADRSGLVRTAGGCSAVLAGMAMGGCLFVGGERELAYAARVPMGVATMGDKSERVAVWQTLVRSRAALTSGSGNSGRGDSTVPRPFGQVSDAGSIRGE